MHLSEPKEFIEIKSRYADMLLKTITGVGLVALAVSLWQVPLIGWQADNTTDSIGYFIILNLYIFRKKINTSVKIGIIVLFAYLIGTTGLLINSVISMFMPYYILGALFTMLFFDNRRTMWVVTIETVTFISIFLLKIAGIITYANLDPNFRAYNNTNWLNYIFTFLLFVILILVLSKRFYDILFKTIEKLNGLNDKLTYEVANKESAFEEIAATEEELKTTNDELVDVNAELSIRNKELIATLWKLQESETRFKNLFDMASDAFLIIRGEVIIDCNKAAESIFKLQKQEIIGKTTYELSPEFQTDGGKSDLKVKEILETVVKSNHSMLFEWDHLNGNREIFTTQVNLNYFSFNKEIYYHAIVRDITDQKRFERTLIESEEKFKNLFELSPAAISLSQYNNDLKYLDVNKSFEKLIQLPKEQIINKTLSELGFTVPDDLYKELRNEIQTKGYFKNIEVPIKLNNGSIIECLLSGMLINIMNKPLVMNITVDITELKQIQMKLQQYQNYLEDIVNERTSEIKNLNVDLCKTNEELKNSNEELIQQREELAATLEELRVTQSKLIQSEKMASLGILTSGLAHEINNPINFISSGVYGMQVLLQSLTDYIINTDCYKKESAIKKQMTNTDDQESIDDIISGTEKLMENIQLGVERASSIVQSLKTFAYKGTGGKELYNIHTGINATLVMVSHLTKDRIEIIKNFGDIPDVHCLSSQINQVFMNIIYNAIDSINGTGSITIKTFFSPEKDKIIVSFADTGSGIPENIKKHIFEPFFTTKEVGKGTGLGLSISYNIIKEHNGDLFFTSEEQKGTTFYIELPIKVE